LATINRARMLLHLRRHESRHAMPHDALVLLVDNHADNLEMYAEYLQLRGFRVIPCSDSQASIETARRLKPDIILLELRMTGMNGIQVLGELRKDPALAHVPVVALTASVMTRERAAAAAAGFTELLPKPFFPEDLATAITRIIAASRASRPSHGGLRGAQGVVRQPPIAQQSDPTRPSAEFPP
jgi:two-component system cell cycle response regulator DivK